MPIFVKNGWQKSDLFLTLLRENFGIPRVVRALGAQNFGPKFSRKILPIFVRNGWQKYDLFLTLLRENFGIPRAVMT